MAGLGHHLPCARFGHQNCSGFEGFGEGYRCTNELWRQWWQASGISSSAAAHFCFKFKFYSNMVLEVSFSYIYFQGDFKVQEDRKHRKTYKALGDSEQKLQFFSARQIACRVLGSRGYLCQKVLGCFAKIFVCILAFNFFLLLMLPLFMFMISNWELLFSSAGYLWKIVCVQE